MIELDEPAHIRPGDPLLTALEARVIELESALHALLAEQPAPPPEDFAKTVRLAVLAEAEAGVRDAAVRDPIENLGITAAFAVLDSRVAEAAEHESRLARPSDLAPPLTIDPALIRDPFSLAPAPAPAPTYAPAPRLRCALEDFHPSILKQVTDTWPSAQCRDLLQRLIAGDLARLEPGAMSEITLLRDMLGTPARA